MSQVLVIAVGVVILVIVIVGVYVAWLSFATRSRRPLEEGFEYVYVEDDGSAREVTDVERRRLATEYGDNDSRRPYIKLRYESLDIEGRRRGFLRRRQLPPGVVVRRE